MAPRLEDRYARAAARERGISEDQIEAFSLRLERFLNQHVGKIIDGLKLGKNNAVAAARQLATLEESLLELGLDDIVDDLAEIYGDKMNYVKSKFDALAGVEVVYNSLDVDSITQLIKFDIESVKLRTFSTVGDLRSAVMRSVIIGENPRQLYRDEFGKLQTSLNTEQNTALRGFERAISVAKAEELDLQLFLYSGPVDDKTRDFCASRAGKVHHVDELAQWDNEQDLPVEIYLGGYNCRHSIDFISVFSAPKYEMSDAAREYVNDQTNSQGEAN